ncbi:MAG: hypothetical protein GXY25_13585 [Pirellulaceae bacterium]|jgi:hypothetical protein|nr:hypothetical protein [Thermoguttaceae bacterium]MDI9446517.1 hypothetical protein [Planctomycetota bacterium]NLZ01556.1 hypothetical protein [Pirellulaceae bacterium]
MRRTLPLLLAAAVFLPALPAAASPPVSPPASPVAGANAVEAYRVRWWGAEGSQHDRPIHHVLRIDNGAFELRHGIVPGRPLADYRLPYWPIRSFVSVIGGDAELPHVPQVSYTQQGRRRTESLVVQEGFELASAGDADALKVANQASSGPLLQEHLLIVRRGSPALEVVVRVTNRGEEPLRAVAATVSYRQDFNWSSFGAAGQSGQYEPIHAPGERRAAAAFAYSSGMKRGYEIIAGDGCELAFQLDPVLNRWQVSLAGRAAELKSGDSLRLHYVLRVLGDVPQRVAAAVSPPKTDWSETPFARLDNLPWKQAPVDPRRRVTLSQVIAGLEQPKTRGLNLRTSRAGAWKDLETMKQWGANLVILPLGDAKRLGEQVGRARELGMEVFVQGRGAFDKGPPSFEPLWQATLSSPQMPDAFGQDEDHHYWHAPLPPRKFETDFGHPMALATQEEKALYWSRCMRDKWASVLDEVRRHAPGGQIWFYTPAPGVAHVDPLDCYDVFFRTMAELGPPLSVFPFYYGIEYNQAEYMVRRWKDAGAGRVVFLPMRGFLARPSQFLRVVTAARRGGADGVCGFSFAVGEERPEDAWQWKSVMVAGWANFPTRELEAVAFLEEPAELVEALASLPVAVIDRDATGADRRESVARLNELLPRGARLVEHVDEEDQAGRLLVRIGGPEIVARGDWPFRFEADHPAGAKGVVQMAGRTVSVCGRDAAAIDRALGLLVRFAELARAESGK